MNRLPLLLALPAFAAAAPLDYNRDIRPILSENCFHCHGFDEKARKAKLRLDVAEDAYAQHDDLLPVKPGDPAQSEVWLRVSSNDPDDQMPPPKAHLTLTAEEKGKLKLWIEQGAKYAPHWAFIAPRQDPVPEGANAVDHFVRARLAREGLEPAAAADRATLIRRVSLDLTGLPPAAEEVLAFVADEAPDAYARLVDRLLASSHFGERMALDWLDAARYADTNGFSIDGGRQQWLWRDYVINAFNTNKPYDRFLVEQLAGDRLPSPTEEQLIATGFERNNMVTHEGGTIPEENLTNYNVDRVKTLGEAVLGLTLACAQCHDHKFDPIKQRDYYGLFAYFNTLSDRGLDGDGGRDAGPARPLHTPLRTAEAATLPAEIAQVREALAHPEPAALAAWEKEQLAALAARGRGFRLLPVQALKISTPNHSNCDIVDGHILRVTSGGGLAAYDVSLRLPPAEQPITGLRAVFYPKKEGEPALGFGPKGSFVLSAISCSADASPGDQVNQYRLLRFRRATANTWQEKFPPEDALDLRNENGWSPEPGSPEPPRFTVTFAEPIHAATQPWLTAQLNFGYGGSQIAGRFELFAMTGEDDDGTLPATVAAALQAPERTEAQQLEIVRWFSAHAPATERARIRLANLEERLAAQTQPFPAMIMDVSAKPRETFILNRGDYAQPTEKVGVATPAFLPAAPAQAPPDRLGLAQWITMRENPLTARVAVNRFWQMLFGTGLVRTAADFGAQGGWPSHPELLDWLAVDFMDRGWDVKALLREIVLSETYRQSSAATPAALERDPANRLLARGPRFRLPAELVRDEALKISGLLVDRLGGPSVNPYLPGDLWREVSHYGSTPATAQTFVQDHGEKLYRRSLYTYWKRTVPPPDLSAFDAPGREVCLATRSVTNTPLQALVLLNDVQYVEAARAFAERILAQPGDDSGKVRWAFCEATSRLPHDAESARLLAALARERAHFAAQPESALASLSEGESPRQESLPPAEHAAWMQIAATLLNLSETITRN